MRSIPTARLAGGTGLLVERGCSCYDSDVAAKKLSAFGGGITIVARSGERDPLISGITYDSRRAGPGSLFVALDGLHTDGYRYIDDAIDRGAAAVICTRMPTHRHTGVAYLQVADARLTLSQISANFYDDPSARLDVIGVTGTDGKSTTVYLIHQLLTALGRSSGFLSTIQILTGDNIEKNHYRQSTPEASEVQAILAEMAANGKQAAVVEATSHGLSHKTNRLANVRFKVGILTNITHEHLEFHGSLENYVSDKANLFRGLEGEGAFGVVNAEDPHADFFRRESRAPVYSYGTTSPAELRAEEIQPDAEGTNFTLVSGPFRRSVRINLPGLFNVDNALAAVLTVWKYTGEELSTIAEALPGLKAAVGRMHAVRMGQPFEVIVDYAHTPGAFDRLLPSIRAQCAGRLIALFGSAGERDVEKRSIQGRIADEYCDVIVLADEDPRGEVPIDILHEIAAGISGRTVGERLHLIPDRLTAIRKAFELAAPGDFVLLLGKGHETSIIYAGGAISWNEIEAAERCLSELGYRKPDSP